MKGKMSGINHSKMIDKYDTMLYVCIFLNFQHATNAELLLLVKKPRAMDASMANASDSSTEVYGVPPPLLLGTAVLRKWLLLFGGRVRS